MKNLNYPLDFKFKITTLSSDFNITDRNGKHIAYVRQKMFKLKEDVVVFRDEEKSAELFRIKADRWLDFNASYSITGADGTNYGKLTRKGMRSIWKSTYEVYNENNQHKYAIREDNAWVKFWDDLVGELPIIGWFTGYFLNPTYSLKDSSGKTLFILKKMPSLLGRRFQLNKLTDSDNDETLIVLSYLMMVLLERMRG